jgi:hypothetical protein
MELVTFAKSSITIIMVWDDGLNNDENTDFESNPVW